MLAIGLLYIAYIMFRCVLWILNLSNTFNMEGFCVLLNPLLASNEMIMWFFEFDYIVDCITYFHLLNQHCVPGMRPIWSWWMTILICSWIQFPRILLSISALIFINLSGVVFLFLFYGVFWEVLVLTLLWKSGRILSWSHQALLWGFKWLLSLSFLRDIRLFR